MPEVKETIPFSFDEIYQGIVDKFAEKGYDSPYDGSNLAQLITSMAYVTSMLNANTAVNINETILSLAQKRPNIIQDARMLGYECEKVVSYVYDLELEFLETKAYTIPKYSFFTAGEKKYYYMGDDIDINATAGDKISISVKEGNLIKYEDEPQNLRQVVANLQYFDIPYTNVEKDGIDVFVTFYSLQGILSTKTKFTRSQTLLIDVDDRFTREFVRIDNDEMGTPRVYFVLSGVGYKIPRGAIIEFNVLISSGVDGAMLEDPTLDQDDIKINTYTLKIKGATEESNDSIKMNAPILHNTAGRVVTADDYEVVCRKHSACNEACVFGGEDEVPVKIGNLFFCLTPGKAVRTFTELSGENNEWQVDYKEDIYNNYLLAEDLVSTTVDVDGKVTNSGVIDDIRRLNMPALAYNIRNPHYILMDFDIEVIKYALASVKKDVRKNLFDLVSEYILKLEVFESEFFKANMINILSDYLTEITGLEMDVQFHMMLNEKSISEESIYSACYYNEPVINPYLMNPTYQQPKEKAIHIYLDTPFEGMYDNNKMLILENLPKIDTVNFMNGEDLTVDFSTYVADSVKDLTKEEIVFFIYIGTTKVGTYTIYNKRTTYIKIKIYCKNDSSFLHPDFTQVNESEFSTTRYMHIQYPSQNFRVLRSSIFKLNNVKIK